MNNATVITEARGLLHDDAAPYRHSDASLYRYLNDGYQSLWGERAEAFSLTAVVVDAPIAITEAHAAENILVQPRYSSALAYYVAGRGLSEDAEHAGNAAMAAAYFSQWLLGIR